MPILNTGTSKRQKIPVPKPALTIVLASLMLVACQNIITLDAVLVGHDALVHTYLWEQLSGSPVTFLTPVDEQSVSWQQPLIRDDKVFRFWLDKGTLIEQYADILVTLVSLDPLLLPAAIPGFGKYGLDTQIIQPPYPFVPAPSDHPPGVVTINNTEQMLVYSPVPDNTNVVGLQLRIIDVSTGAIANGPLVPSDINYVRGLFSGPGYRLDTVIDNHGFITVLQGNNMRAVPPPNTTLDVYDDSKMRFNYHSNLQFTSTTISRSIGSVSQSDSMQMNYHYNTNLTTTSSTVTRQLESFSLEIPNADQTINVHFSNARGLTTTKTVTGSTYTSIG